jgi:hypothetical protein
LIYHVGVSRHEDPKSWFWLRGADGAARALAAVRHQTGLTQAQIAAQLGMDRTTVLNMEAGGTLRLTASSVFSTGWAMT